MYGVYSLGGFALLSIVTCASVVGAFALAAASVALARRRRAGDLAALPPRAHLRARSAWSIRAQMLTLPLYTGLLWLLAAQARRPTNRVWIALPMLVALGEHARERRARRAARHAPRRVRARPQPRRNVDCEASRLIVLAPLAILVTPYGPVTTARYYHLLLVDPPFAGQVTEWRWPDACLEHRAPSTCSLAIAIPLVIWGRRRLTVFDIGVLALTLAGALTAIRGNPVVRVRLHGVRPRRDRKKPREPQAGRAEARPQHGRSASGSSAANLAAAAALFFRSDAWFEDYWPNAPAEAVRAELRPGDRVFVPDRFSDWLLWKIPELRGRIAYDVRFEIYDKEFFDRLADYNWEQGSDWKSFADGYRIVVVDETNRSHTADFLKEPGHARDLPQRRAHDHRPTEKLRPASRRATAGTRRRRLARRPSSTPGRPRAERTSLVTTFGVPRQDRRVRPDDPGIVAVDDDPFGTTEQRHRVDVATSREVTAGGVRDAHRRASGHEGDGIRVSAAIVRSESCTRCRPAAPRRRPAPRARRKIASIAEHTQHRRGCKRRRRGAPIRAIPKHRRGDEERDDRRHAVVPRIRHRAEVRETVREQLRERDRGEARGEHEEEQEREPEPDEVGEVLSLRQRTDDRAGIGERASSATPDRRAAHLVVEAEEHAVPAGEVPAR